MSAEITPAIEQAERALVETWHGTVGRAFHPTRVKEARATVTAALRGRTIADVLYAHQWENGVCGCGWQRDTVDTSDLGDHVDHQADEIRTALLGADS